MKTSPEDAKVNSDLVSDISDLKQVKKVEREQVRQRGPHTQNLGVAKSMCILFCALNKIHAVSRDL